MVELIAAPFDLGGKSRGAALGPAAILHTGVADELSQIMGQKVHVTRLHANTHPTRHRFGLKHRTGCLTAMRAVRKAVAKSLEQGFTPVVVGGDHSLAAASVGAALDHFGPDTFVLWIDAHTDLNTSATSPSGHMHGMPVAILAGRTADGAPSATHRRIWDSILGEFTPKVPLDADHVGWIGLRDVDDGELDWLAAQKRKFAATMDDIDQFGINGVLGMFVNWTHHTRPRIWVSFDVDSFDPILAPGTGTAVRGGLTYREGNWLAEMLCQLHAAGKIELIGADVVEVNPCIDHNNQTAVVAAEWIGSLFGKRILRGIDGIVD